MNTNNGSKLAGSPNGVGRHRFSSLTLIDRPEITTHSQALRFVRVHLLAPADLINLSSPTISDLVTGNCLGIDGSIHHCPCLACVAKIEEAIPAQGKLEPQGTVNEVQVPIGGVVKAIYVNDGNGTPWRATTQLRPHRS